LAREVQLLISAPHDYSFPSGHTLASFEGAGAIFFCNKKYGIPALVLAALIAFSRLYLYVHYVTDVLVGAILGFVFALCAYVIVSFILKMIAEKKKEQ
jgi:undecaprenyl-diphosphatase